MGEKKIKFINGEMLEYEILKLVDEYDPILNEPTIPVDFESMQGRDVAYHAMSIAETLGELQGLGLSANQVGIKHRMCAINMGEQIWILINPTVTWSSTETSEFKEGCLSFPGLYLALKRPKSIKVKFQAINGQVLEQQFDGLTATVIQHEIDHLDGICYTSKISPIKLDIAKRKVKSNLKKLKRVRTQGAVLA